MRRTTWTLLTTATRCSIAEHSQNKLALVLILFFIPLWASLCHEVVAADEVRFLLRATQQTVTVPGNDLSSLCGALNTVTLICGFMMFSVTFKGGDFDRRLARAGYPHRHLIAAKLAVLVLIAALVCAYATLAVWLNWSPRHPWLLGLGLACGGLTYGGFGVLLGILLRSELSGMMMLIMTSIIDTCLQNPAVNPNADGDLIAYLPSYGALQTTVTAAFTDALPGRYLLLGPLWFLGAIVLAVAVFPLRSRGVRPLRRLAARLPVRLPVRLPPAGPAGSPAAGPEGPVSGEGEGEGTVMEETGRR